MVNLVKFVTPGHFCLKFQKIQMSARICDISSLRSINRPARQFSAEDVKKMSQEEIFSAFNFEDVFPVKAMFERCLALGINVTKICNQSHKSLYHLAAETGDCETLRKLLELNAGLVNEIDYLDIRALNLSIVPKYTPLHYACTRGHLEAAKLLVSYGANVNFPSKTRISPLFEAINFGSLELIEYLLQVGANPMAIDPAGRNALCVAVKKGHMAIIERLLAIGVNPFAVDGDGFSLLHTALENAKPEIIQKLLELKLDINRPCGKAGMRPFDVACCFCDESILELLIKNGAVYDYPLGFNNYTPYYWAISMKNVACVKFLLKLGVDPNIPTLNMNNLESAIESKSMELVELLLSIGLNVNTPSSTGDSLLRIPIIQGETIMVAKLLAKGINPNHKNPLTGSSILHFAVMTPQATPEIVQLLLNYGAFVNMADSELSTPLHRACEAGRADLIEILLFKGAEPNIMNKNGYHPIDLSESDQIDLILENFGGESSSFGSEFYKRCLCCFCSGCFN